MVFHTSWLRTFWKRAPFQVQLNRIGRVLILLIYLISFFGGTVTITQAAADISYIGDIGSATIKTSGTSLTIVTTADVAAGDAIIVGYATDPSQTLEVSVSDGAGNTYEQAAMAISYGKGRTYIFAAYNVTALPSGSNITITNNTAVTAKTAVASVFRGLLSVNVLDQALGFPTGNPAVTGTTPSVGPTGTTTQADELLIGVIGTEGPEEDNPGTWDNSFTAGPRTGTTGGTADTNWTVSLGYQIVSAPGTYTAQKSDITERYWAATIATLKAAYVGPTHTLTMAVDPAGGGTTAPPVGDYIYAENGVGDISAIPAAGYAFVSWTGDVADPNAATTTVTMDADKTVTANFALITHDLTVAVDPSGGGTTDPAVGMHTYAEGEIVPVTATPAAGYVFDSWTGDVADPNAASTTVTMDADKTVTANFAEIPTGVITYQGDIGSATSKVASTTLVVTTDTDVEAGDDIIVAFATYGDPNYTISVTDDVGNTYEEAAQAVCYQHGRTYIFAAYNVTALPSGSEITITHTSVDLTAAVVSVFSGLADVDPLDQSLGYPTDTAASGTQPSVGPTGTTIQANELLIGAVGTEGPVEDDPGIWGYLFSPGPRAGTTGGDATSNWTVAMGYRVVSATGEYTAQKSGITDRYWAAAIATFKSEPVHDLTIAVDPAGGGTTDPTVGVHTYLENSIVDLTATPAAGYEFVSWTGDVTDPNAASTTVTMDADKTVTANFALITYDLTMAVSPSGGGTTDPTVGVHAYNDGMVVPITATAAAGYTFVSWTGDVADPNAASTTVTMDADKTVTANFALVTYDLTMAVSPSGGGTTDPAVGAHTYNEGMVVPITATAAAGYEFVSWTGDVADPNAASTTVTMDADKTVTANFALVTYDLTMAVSPSGGGTTDPAVGVHTYNEGTVVPITATAAAGYTFVSWSGDVADPNAASTTVTMDADKAVTANFALVTYDLTMAVTPSGGGTTDPAAGVHTYEEGTLVPITATAAAGYAFVSWTGAVADPNAASTTVTMDADKTVTANFVEIIPPDTSITDKPLDPSWSMDASFSFTSTKPGSTFECQLDGGGFSACTSPKAYSALAYGEHTFEVRAIDDMGTPDSTPASYNWTIVRTLFLPIVENN